jgi:hypothetical protein
MATEIDHIEISVTREGLESIAEALAIGVTAGIESAVNFKIGYFQLGNAYDSTAYEAKKLYWSDYCTDIYYVDFSEATYEPVSTAAGFAINAVYGVNLIDSQTVEIECYLPPAPGVTYTCNEIMVYTGDGTPSNPYKGFIYGVFPSITKQAEYGLNFKISCKFKKSA